MLDRTCVEGKILQYILPIIIFTAIAGLVALGLCVAATKFEVKEDPLFVQVKEIIGDTNCGACGYAGCAGYTKALTTFEDGLGKCRPMKQPAYDQIDKLLKEAKAEKAVQTATTTAKPSPTN